MQQGSRRKLYETSTTSGVGLKLFYDNFGRPANFQMTSLRGLGSSMASAISYDPVNERPRGKRIPLASRSPTTTRPRDTCPA